MEWFGLGEATVLRDAQGAPYDEALMTIDLRIILV